MREAGELLGVVGLGAVQLPAAIVLGWRWVCRFGWPQWRRAEALWGAWLWWCWWETGFVYGCCVLRAGPGSSADTSTPEAVGALRGVGVGVVGSLLVGVPVAAAVGVALGVSRTQLLISCAAVVAVTSLVLALGLSFGWSFARSLM